MKSIRIAIFGAVLATASFTLTGVALAGSDHHSDGHHASHWSYQGDGAPSHWGDLKHDYMMCKEGMKQSPIDITATTPAKLDDIRTDYTPTSLHVVNNGHTIKVDYNNGSSIVVGGKKYKLLQFHFHSPSEHKINGKPADMVAHLVHQSDDGQLAVIGVLMNEGRKNKAVEAVWETLPHGEGDRSSSTRINVADLLPADMSYYNYSGSLTTPPCSEGVNWMVLQNPVEVSGEQIAMFNKIFAKSVRPVQPLNGRMVKSK